MTELLEKAFAEASSLPEHEQDVLAKAWLEDLAAREKGYEQKNRPQFGSAEGSDGG
jgi:predicted trehalose synthase